MTTQEALKIVLELAEDHRLISRDVAGKPELREKMLNQREAVARVAALLHGMKDR